MGQILTPEFIFTFETNIRQIIDDAFVGASQDLWWMNVAKAMPSSSRLERFVWLLSTAKLQSYGKSHSDMTFENIMAHTQEIENEFAGDALKLIKPELEDKDANGIDGAAKWATDLGRLIAYWPQERVSAAILANPTAYDGLSFFHASHHVNPFIGSTGGTYANTYALPIDDSVTVEEAVANLSTMLARISEVKAPNNSTPRRLKGAKLIVPPMLRGRAIQVTNARTIAQAATSGGGGADVSALVDSFELGQPIVATELGAAYGGSDSTYYVSTAPPGGGGEFDAFIYSEREAFTMQFHGPMTSAQLALINEFQWVCRGRNVVAPGHPFRLFRGTTV